MAVGWRGIVSTGSTLSLGRQCSRPTRLDNAELGFLKSIDGGDDMVGGVGPVGGPAHTHNIIVTGGLPLPVANEGGKYVGRRFVSSC